MVLPGQPSQPAAASHPAPCGSEPPAHPRCPAEMTNRKSVRKPLISPAPEGLGERVRSGESRTKILKEEDAHTAQLQSCNQSLLMRMDCIIQPIKRQLQEHTDIGGRLPTYGKPKRAFNLCSGPGGRNEAANQE